MLFSQVISTLYVVNPLSDNTSFLRGLKKMPFESMVESGGNTANYFSSFLAFFYSSKTNPNISETFNLLSVNAFNWSGKKLCCLVKSLRWNKYKRAMKAPNGSPESFDQINPICIQGLSFDVLW